MIKKRVNLNDYNGLRLEKNVEKLSKRFVND